MNGIVIASLAKSCVPLFSVFLTRRISKDPSEYLGSPFLVSTIGLATTLIGRPDSNASRSFVVSSSGSTES